MTVVYAETVEVMLTALLRSKITADVTLVFVIVPDERETKTGCSVLVTVVTGKGEANGHGITVDTKSIVEKEYHVWHWFFTQSDRE